MALIYINKKGGKNSDLILYVLIIKHIHKKIYSIYKRIFNSYFLFFIYFLQNFFSYLFSHIW